MVKPVGLNLGLYRVTKTPPETKSALILPIRDQDALQVMRVFRDYFLPFSIYKLIEKRNQSSCDPSLDRHIIDRQGQNEHKFDQH